MNRKFVLAIHLILIVFISPNYALAKKVLRYTGPAMNILFGGLPGRTMPGMSVMVTLEDWVAHDYTGTLQVGGQPGGIATVVATGMGNAFGHSDITEMRIDLDHGSVTTWSIRFQKFVLVLYSSPLKGSADVSCILGNDGMAFLAAAGSNGSWESIDILPEKNLGKTEKTETTLTEKPDTLVCNPINAAAGNKLQTETDYTSSEAIHLVFQRTYNSQDILSTDFGAGWKNNYRKLINRVSETSIVAIQEDGRQLVFTLDNSGQWVSDPDVLYTLRVLKSENLTSYQLTTPDDSVELYGENGKLLSITSRSGQKLTLTYNDNLQLASVVGQFGQTLTFAYGDTGNVVEMLDPAGNSFQYGYDSNNNLVSVTYPDGNIRQYLYENSSFPNALTGIIDENGDRFATYGYDDQGRAISTEHAGGVNKASLEYTPQGGTTVTDSLGNIRDYTYITQFDLLKPASVSEQGCACGNREYTYDANGFLASKTDFNGNVTAYVRDARGLELTRTEAAGTPLARVITTIWHPTYHLPQSIAEPDRVTTFSYDDHGNMLSKTITGGGLTRTWSFTYDSLGQALTATDPNANTTTMTHAATGGLASSANALGHVTLIADHDAHGRPLTIQDPNGLVTTLTYSPRGWLTSSTKGAETTTLAYDKVGQLTRITLPDGSFLAFTYDAAHRLVGMADAHGDRVVITLDAMSNRIKEEVFGNDDQLRQTRSQAYDALHRPVRDIGASNQATVYGYDNNGNLTTVTDPLNHVTRNAYDALDRLIQTVDPTGSITDIAYNANDLPLTVTDPRALVTRYGYDGLGNRVSTQSPDTAATTRTYDAAGNVLTVTDARGSGIAYQYDALNRPTGATSTDGKATTFGYDAGTYGKGRLTSMTDEHGSTTWEYDQHGRLLQKRQQTGSVILTTGYQYDPTTGKLAFLTYPSGRRLSFSHDPLSGKLSSISADNAAFLGGIGHQPFGPAAFWTQGAGASSHVREFNLDGRLSRITIGGAPDETITLTHDQAGRIVKIADNAARPRLAKTGLTNFQYGQASNRISGSTGGIKRTYANDAMGNITGDGVHAFAYDHRGRMKSSTKGAVTTHYLVNGLGQRIAKTGAGVATGGLHFLYDESGHLLGEYDAAGNPIQETVWLDDLPVGVLTPGKLFFVNPDHLGAPLSITDEAGKVVWRWDRDPYGNGQPNENPSGLGAFVYNLRFPGQYYDKETELHYNYFRDYNPRLGRYIQSDPIELAGGINLYQYAHGNPVNKVDHLGLKDSSNSKLVHDILSSGLQAKNNLTKTSGKNIISDTFGLLKDRIKEGIATLYAGEENKKIGNDLYERGIQTAYEHFSPESIDGPEISSKTSYAKAPERINNCFSLPLYMQEECINKTLGHKNCD